MATTPTVAVPAPAAIPLSRLNPTPPPAPDEEQHHSSSSSDDGQPPEGATVFTPPNVSTIKLQFLATNCAIFLVGLNDAATGALVPYLQTGYDIGLLFVALVYLFNFVGWAIAAGLNVHLHARIGTGGVLLFGATLQAVAHALQLWRPPFPLFVATYLVAGLGVAFQDAQVNSFVGGVSDAHRWLGVLHGVYGVGALVSPLIATRIASSNPEKWHLFYCVLLGAAACNVAFIFVAFRKGLGKGAVGAKERAGRDLKKTVSNRTVLLMSLFFFTYVGAEVTAGGWVVEFLIRVRKGKPSRVGYVASGFWGGLTAGRIFLADITYRLGERRMIFFYLCLAMIVQLIFWFVPNIIANAVMISLLGFFIGPFFPTGISVTTKLIPRELYVPAVGFMSSTGQAGSAAFPFLTGAIAAKMGVQVLQPILVALLAAMAVLWYTIPKVERRTV